MFASYVVGVAESTTLCGIESPAIINPTEWPFGVNDTGNTLPTFQNIA